MGLENNLQYLKQQSYHIITSPNQSLEPVNTSFFHAKSGALSCQVQVNERSFLIHSKYDPITEAKRFINSQLDFYLNSKESFSKIVIYGFGCGHHLKELLDEFPIDEMEIEIWETNVTFFYQVLSKADFKPIFSDPRVRLRITDNLEDIKQAMATWENDKPFFMIHEPSLKIMPKPLKEFQMLLEKYLMFLKSAASSKDLLEENFKKNLLKGFHGIKQFIGVFTNVPVIMVSAGPSLNKNIHLLNKAKKHSMITSVGTALKPLLNHQIIPDFIMITDPKDLVLKQITNTNEWSIPLFILSTANHQLQAYHHGPTYIVFQKGYVDAEEEAYRRNEPLIETGGSVATTLFAMLDHFGFNPIGLVGQDLAFTNQETHVKGAHNYRQFSNLTHSLSVLDFSQKGMVNTSKNLKNYLDWFIHYAKKLNGTKRLYNATEGGVYIKGFEHLSLDHFIKKIEHFNVEPYRKQLQTIIYSSSNDTRE